MIRPYLWDSGEEWCMVVFASTAREAKVIGYNNSPAFSLDYMGVRAKRLPVDAFDTPDAPGACDHWDCDAGCEEALIDFGTGLCTCGSRLTLSRPVNA